MVAKHIHPPLQHPPPAAGRLFGDRYKAVPVEGRSGFYCTLANYVHLNPARARLIDFQGGKSLLDYRWSSLARGFVRPPKKRPSWLGATVGLAVFGWADTAAGRRRYVERLEAIARSEPAGQCGLPALPADGRLSHLRRGWYWGSQEFAEKLHGLLSAYSKPVNRTYRSSRQHQAHGERQAEELLQAGLRAQKLSAAALARLPGSDGRKVAIARHLWTQTTVSQILRRHAVKIC